MMMDNPEPEVTLITWTKDPLETVYSVWEASKTEDPLMTTEYVKNNVSPEKVEELFRAVIAQRIPIGEHIDFVFMVSNVSVSWREQAVRHRIGTSPSPERVGADIVVDRLPDLADSSFWSQSMRIMDVREFAKRGQFRLPETIRNHPDERVLGSYMTTMHAIAESYKFLVESGIPMEDARELIPLGTHHRISWRLNIGSLQHIVGKRGCVTGDTAIPLLDGRTRTMQELLEEYGTEDDFWVYSCDKSGRVVPGRAHHNGVTQKKAELVEVALDNGQTIRATPDHRFMLRDGGYSRADQLAEGQSLMPLYRDVSDGTSERPQDRIIGYEMVYMPGADVWEFTHRAMAREAPGDGRTVIHHDDINKRNNAKKQWANPKIRAKMVAGLRQAMSGGAAAAPEKGVVNACGRNHKVVSVQRISVREDVYDLSVDDHHNYATDAGVFIHNCWILQLGIWGPVITGMVEELATKVHPIFRELVTPPCIKGDDFKGCIYHEENRRRYTGEDCHSPCPLHVTYHHLPAERAKAASTRESFTGPILPEPSDNIPRFDEMEDRARDYKAFWGRDPYTGKRLRVLP